MGHEISELDQRLLVYNIRLLYEKFDTVGDLVKFWTLYGPCTHKCPKPEIRRPWSAGLGLTDFS